MADVFERVRPALGWVKAHPVKAALSAAVALLALWLLVVFTATPRLDRDWVDHLARMPDIEKREDGFALSHARDWTYTAEGDASRSEVAIDEAFGELRNVWFMVEPHPGMKAMAHTLLLFEFADDRMIGLTIEARKEEGESFSALWGTFNAFELSYIWATPKDLLTRRVVYLGHDVLVYPLALSDEQEVSFLQRLLNKTIAVSTKARWYNTLFSNCTNELAKTAELDWHYAFILTGYSAERLFELGLIPGETFDTAKAKALLTDEIRSWNGLSNEAFNQALLGELREREAAPP